jgi:hypothetical protein
MSTPSSLDRLADVELQLVMQGLDFASLLKFARVSRRARHLAQSVVVWKHVPAIHIAMDVPNLGHIRYNSIVFANPAWQSNPLLRHVPVTMTLETINSSVPWFYMRFASGWMERLPHKISALDVSGIELDPPFRQVFLTHPSLQHMRKLRIEYNNDWNDPATLSSIAQLPHLQTLEMQLSGDIGEICTHVHRCPALRNLSVRLHFREEGYSIFSNFAQITRVRLVQMLLRGSDHHLPLLFASLHCVTHMTLEDVHFFGAWDPVAMAFLTGAWSALSSLHTLYLVRADNCDTFQCMLPYVHHAPMLRQLHLVHDGDPYCIDDEELFQLLPTCPHLHITIHVSTEAFGRCSSRWVDVHPHLRCVVDTGDTWPSD